MITQTNPMTDLCDGLLPLLTRDDSYTFPKFIANVCRLIEGAIRESIKNYLENMDKKFKESPGRTSLYHVKDTAPRTIITMYVIANIFHTYFCIFLDKFCELYKYMRERYSSYPKEKNEEKVNISIIHDIL